MTRLPPQSTRTYTLFPYPPPFRSDVEQLGVAPVTLDGPVLGIARAAQRLDRFARDLHRIFAGEQDAARGVETRRLSRVAGLGDVIDIGTRGLEHDIHVGDLRLHQLERPDRLAELLALADIRNDGVEARLHDAELEPREHDAFIIEP